MRLSALFEEFCHFLRVEKGAARAQERDDPRPRGHARELRQVDGPPRQASPRSSRSADAPASQGTGAGGAYLGIGQEGATAL
jgi:hypothetical protein